MSQDKTNGTRAVEQTAPLMIRRIARAEMDLAVAWAAEEGWNPGLHDAECFYSADPDGFFIGEVGGQPAGCVSAVAYDDAFGFGGFFIVRPEYRSKGFGGQLSRTVFEYMGTRNLGADAVVAEVENYRRLGLHPAYRNVRYEGVGGGRRPDAVAALGTLPFAAVLAYDTQFFPVPRERFLRGWLAMPNAIGYAMTRAGMLKGYGVIRSCHRGLKIGPLFADGPAEAETLFRALASHAPGSPLFLDVPEPNQAAVALAERHGMKRVFETFRMYTKEAPKLPLDGIFGITSFELG